MAFAPVLQKQFVGFPAYGCFLGCDDELPVFPLVAVLDISEHSASLDEFLTRLQSSGADFFAMFVRGIIEREATEKWIDRSGEIAQPLLSVEEHCKLLSLIAIEMWQARVEILKTETLEFVTDYFSETLRKAGGLAAQIRQRIKGHALLVASSNMQGAIEFDHVEFKEHFLGEAIAEMCGAQSTSVRSDLLNTLRKGPLPAHTLHTLITALRRADAKRQREIATLLSDVALLDGQSTFTHENCSAVILALLSGVEGESIILKRMSFAPQSLRDTKLAHILFENCFFAPTSLENTSLNDCRFNQCHFSRLDLHASTHLGNVIVLQSQIDALSTNEGLLIHYDPAACRSVLLQLGVAFPDVPAELPLQQIQPHQPENAVVQFQKVLRIFLRTTHVSDGVVRMKLGSHGSMFMNDCVPTLLNRGILIEMENRGGGQFRQFKLGRPMAILSDALATCGGSFSQFLDNASPDL